MLGDGAVVASSRVAPQRQREVWPTEPTRVTPARRAMHTRGHPCQAGCSTWNSKVETGRRVLVGGGTFAGAPVWLPIGGEAPAAHRAPSVR